jgi:glutamyl-tRNA synthetase
MNSIDEIELLIYRYALKNAVEHNGKVKSSAVLGKILNEKPELKNNIKTITQLITKVINDLNKLSFDEQRRKLEERFPEQIFKKDETKQKILPPLPNTDKHPIIVTRFSPNPDCVLHIGSIRALILSHDYARTYRGKFLLRFEDTDPRLKKSVLEFYDLIKEDMEWLECKWDAEYIQSDRLTIYYEYAKKLIEINGAYICTCEPMAFKNKLLASEHCDCRIKSTTEQINRWEKMLEGYYATGEAIVRIKTDLDHPNPAVRDWPALRIIDTVKHPHPRVGSKYHIWPLYNFACGIDDHLLGISHIIRGKEHYTNMVRQKYMYEYFKWKYPEAIHYGRLKIPGATLSKSKIIQSIREGLVTDFSDPRLATLIALKRRGIMPGTLRKITIEVGPKPVDSQLSWENIYATNRKIIDKISNRYFFISNPILLTIREVSKKISQSMPKHPDFPERNKRIFKIAPIKKTVELNISKNDLELIREKRPIRLMGLFNILIDEINVDNVIATYQGESHIEARKADFPIIQWVPEDKNVKTEVIMPEMNISKGLSEQSLEDEKINNIVQLVRFGFGRIDNIGNEVIRIFYAHS